MYYDSRLTFVISAKLFSGHGKRKGRILSLEIVFIKKNYLTQERLRANPLV